MAVFVRVFRLAMVFFNIYDSYKVLKLLPSSSRNNGKPSLRAMSQRKRDMKGCLAVWIVWSCFVIYERSVEGVASLFVPFYDEFKSLVMLFLIMTRARGAEPIYLHVIRPFLKPYTATVDQLLDFAHVIGDVTLGLATLPFIYVVEWWTRRFGSEPESLDTETEASSSPLSTVPSVKGRPLSRRTVTSKSTMSMRTSGSQRQQIIGDQNPRGIVNETDKKLCCTAPLSCQNADEAQASPALQDSHIPHELTQVDEWRQYPAFPAAYPPTPLVKQTQLIAATVVSTSNALYPPIPEEVPQQGFRQSLLPPHNTPNPSYADGSSDKVNHPGVQTDETEHITISVMEVDEVDSPMDRADEYESEDEFNITLRTPDPPLRILTSLGPPSATSVDGISPLSLPSRSSALTTVDNGSSLRTPSSTKSFGSSDLYDQPPVLAGCKRPLQHISSNVNSRARTSRANRTSATIRVARIARAPVRRIVVSPQRRHLRSLQTSIPQATMNHGLAGPGIISPDTNLGADDNGQVAPKRLRMSTKTPHAAQPARRRVARPASPSKMANNRSTGIHRPSHSRSSARLRGATTVKLATLSDS